MHYITPRIEHFQTEFIVSTLKFRIVTLLEVGISVIIWIDPSGDLLCVSVWQGGLD